MVGFRLLTVARRTDLTCVSGVGGTERGLLGYPGVRTAPLGGGELSAIGPPNNPPCTLCTGAEGLEKKL